MDEIVDTTVRPEVKKQGPKFTPLYTRHIWGAWHVVHRDSKRVRLVRCGSKKAALSHMRSLLRFYEDAIMRAFEPEWTKPLPVDYDA